MYHFEKALKLCYKFIERDEFKGWDPYDGLTTKISVIKKLYYPRLFFFYLMKFSPLNLRYLFLIPKREFTQPYMFLALANLELNRIESAKIFIEKIIADSKFNKFNVHCWDGLDMPIQMLDNYKEKGAPNVISTELASRAIINYIKKGNFDQYLFDILLSVEDYFLSKMKVSYQNHIHFKYYDVTPDELFVFNSNANVCAFLAEFDEIRGTRKNNQVVKNVIYSIIDNQHPSGYWNYNLNLKSKNQKRQVDFHQGFILDDFLRIIKVYGDDPKIIKSYELGLNFYFEKQFESSGRSFYRIPKKWPVNIHNQAQGIITFYNAYKFGMGEKYLNFAKKIAIWTIENMQNKNGSFSYLKYPFFTNRIPYLRWNNCAMIYALSVLLNMKE